ncbi:MAG: NADH-quinone oxidoreductase subunit M [bacterium]|nr:NADH-quinone oxidoreductase subunit M [bacterium]
MFPILSILTFLPLAGACLVLLFIPKDKEELIRKITLVISLVELILAVFLVYEFNPGKIEMQFVEKLPWIPSVGIEYFMGVDGISVLIILLTAILTSVSILASWTSIKNRVREFYPLLLFIETAVIGSLASLDFVLFYIFWEIMLIPMFFLIGVWGGENRLYAAVKFFLFTLFGSVLMLVGILALYFKFYELTGGALGGGELTFNILKLRSVSYPINFQLWVFAAFFVGWAIKIPMFPFHTWLPDAHVQAPTAGSIILAGVLLKMGAYGFLRFSLPLFPYASHAFAPLVGILAVIAIIYGAFLAISQKDMKKLVAYSSVSHMGFIVLGIFSFSQFGLEGAILQLFNHGVTTGALFLCVGLLYDRAHTKQIEDFGGLSKQVPIFTFFFTLFLLASMGVPALSGFMGEFLILTGAVKNNVILHNGLYRFFGVFAVAGIPLGAAYSLWLYQRVMLGHKVNPKHVNMLDLNLREGICLATLAIFVIWIGVYPDPFLRIFRVAAEQIVLQAGKAGGI